MNMKFSSVFILQVYIFQWKPQYIMKLKSLRVQRMAMLQRVRENDTIHLKGQIH